MFTAELNHRPDQAELPELPNTADLARFFSVSRKTIHRWIAVGQLPAPIRISRNTLRWQRATILSFVQKKSEQPA